MMLSSFIKSLKMYFHPENIPVFKIFGGEENVVNIINDIEKNPEYNDGKLLINDKYLLPRKEKEDLMKLEDVLGVYIRVHKTNYVIDRYNIVITNKYNESHWATYYPNEKDLLEKTMDVLVLKCKNAKFGYSNETLKHINDNLIKID